MHNNFDLPMLPSIDIYDLRCISNSINSFNKNIINYDYIIYGRIQKIAIKMERLNEIIRNSIPILNIKLHYIINSELNDLSASNTISNDYLEQQRHIFIADFIDDLMSLQFELEKLISKIRFTLESLLVYHLDEPNKLKYIQYVSQKESLIISKNAKQCKVNELNNDLSIIVAAEEIILKNKLTDFFDKYFQGKELIDSINIPPNKKDILKAAINYVKNLLNMVDDGLEFTQLVDVRLYVNGQIIEIREEINTIDTNIFRLSQLISYSYEITMIDIQKESVIVQMELLKKYWEAWCHFINKNASEKTLNLAQINVASQTLVTYLHDIENQYQRQLPD
ncbi:alpha-xenorhabdolysin family binary toxin subunit B [Providencia sp.]|uniref:alpha-xenorhabdolysin family binary toxin subunit B n=1 Tax=Providencia sp. TaxID=589 RepID=UPI001B43D4C4|nr:alpha-xenorhabdolysin family binary toxin subunit B [Providencia sp.]